MQTLQQMLSSTPNALLADAKVLDQCIEACLECTAACTACADACLGEEGLDMLRRCIRLNEDCADTCEVVARVLTRQSRADLEFIRSLLDACRRISAACGAERLLHAAHHEHCRLCASLCQKCDVRCDEMARALTRAH